MAGGLRDESAHKTERGAQTERVERSGQSHEKAMSIGGRSGSGQMRRRVDVQTIRLRTEVEGGGMQNVCGGRRLCAAVAAATWGAGGCAALAAGWAPLGSIRRPRPWPGRGPRRAPAAGARMASQRVCSISKSARGASSTSSSATCCERVSVGWADELAQAASARPHRATGSCMHACMHACMRAPPRPRQAARSPPSPAA